MKKLMIAMAMIAMTAGFSLRAQDNATATPAAVCCADRQQCADSLRQCAFSELNLSEAQQAQVQALMQKVRADRADRAKAKRDAKAGAKAQRRAAREQARKDFLAQLKNILTPEQYVQFLESNYVKGTPKGPKMGKKDGRRGPKGDRKGPRPCPQRNAGQCPQAPRQ